MRVSCKGVSSIFGGRVGLQCNCRSPVKWADTGAIKVWMGLFYAWLSCPPTGEHLSEQWAQISRCILLHHIELRLGWIVLKKRLGQICIPGAKHFPPQRRSSL